MYKERIIRLHKPILKIKMNHNVARDFFKAVLFFNHVPYWSNELEFINLIRCGSSTALKE